MAVSGNADAPEIVDRKHIVIIDRSMAGAAQPYHFAEKLRSPRAESHLESCATVSGRLACAAIEEVLGELNRRNYSVAGCAILLAAGRVLPPLAGILASHALIHTAEGEFFRKVFREAFEQLRVRVTGFRERDLSESAVGAFGNAAPAILQRISSMRSVVGSPWTKDEKTAALAAWMLLSGKSQ